MGVVKRGLTGIGVSIAVGAVGYAADRVFETPPEVVHEMYMDCMRLDNDAARVDCVDEATDDLSWPNALQVAGGLGLAASGFLLYEGLADEIRRRRPIAKSTPPVPPAPPAPPVPPSPPNPLG